MLNSQRIFDLTASFVLILLLTPFAILTYPLLLFFVGKPVIFKQTRTGYQNKNFSVYKLRSMIKSAETSKKKYQQQNEAPLPMFKITNDPRFIKKHFKLPFKQQTLTCKVGQFLSISGLDEIPQLWNVLKGEMSLVGPRPLPVQEALALKTIDPQWYKWRHNVKPGIFSIWAGDRQHNKSLAYWKKLERQSLKMNIWQQALITIRVIGKQIKSLLRKFR